MKKLFYLAAIGLLSACQSLPYDITNLKSQFVSLNDNTSIHYKEYGNGSQSIVFVHGFGCDVNAWESQFDAFKNDKTKHLVFVDLPGYGMSSKPHTDYTLEFFGDAVLSVIEKTGSANSILVGHSLGTPVCRNMLFSYPDRIAGMMDIDGVYCLYPKLGDNPTEEELAMAAGYEEAVQGFASSFDGDECHDNIVGFVESLSGPETPKSIKDYAMSVMPATPEYVASSTMHNLIDRKWWPSNPILKPVEIVCTQNSGLEPDNREQMMALYPSAGYTELETCGHFIQMEQPDLINRLIEKLCNDVENQSELDIGS
ncbi:MAG: alpha/beta hydrolase [Bacteroidales bacterium]|nr:alpha/beta hydrolase [Bacteroidales bacterium]